MFEQSSYNIETAAEPAKAGDLFHNYEIRNWDYGPRLYKIAAIAGVGNLLALLIFAQTSLLTMKGCDSPLVSSVCKALDIVDIGQAMLFGTPRDYVDAAYDKTDLGDVEITYVDVSSVESKLEYPSSFQDATTGEYVPVLGGQSIATMDSPFDPNSPNYIPPSTIEPGIPITTPSTGGSLIDTTPVKPRKNPKPIDGELPDSIDDSTAGNNGKGKTGGKSTDGTPEATPIDPNTIVNNVDPGAINKRPFVDYANKINDLIDQKQVNLDSIFFISASGKLNKDGKIDPKTWKWKPGTKGDPKILEVVKDGMGALNDSGLLMYLALLQGRNCDLTVQQDGTKFSIVLQSDVGDLNHANTVKDGLKGAISLAKMGKGGANADQNQLDDLLLLNSASVEAAGRMVTLRFDVPKDVGLSLIQRKLAEQKAAAGKPNGSALGGSKNNSGSTN